MTYHWYWLFWLSYGAWAGLEAWVFSRDRRAAQGVRSDKGSVWFLIAVLVTGLILAFNIAFRYPPTRIMAWRLPIFLFGIGLMWAGMAFRLWAILTLGKFFRTTVILQDGHQLVTAGPYRVLRHPAYTGATLILIGIGLGLGNWLSALVLLVTALLGYGYRMSVEEKALAARFGAAYHAYARDRWRLVPFLY